MERLFGKHELAGTCMHHVTMKYKNVDVYWIYSPPSNSGGGLKGFPTKNGVLLALGE